MKRAVIDCAPRDPNNHPLTACIHNAFSHTPPEITSEPLMQQTRVQRSKLKAGVGHTLQDVESFRRNRQDKPGSTVSIETTH